VKQQTHGFVMSNPEKVNGDINASAPSPAIAPPTRQQVRAQARHDEEAFRTYLHHLDPHASKFTFQFFSDHTKGYAETFTGTPEEGWARVQVLNTIAHGIAAFVTVNETNGRGRKKKDITRARHLFVDADGQDQVDRCLEIIRTTGATPTMIVQSSPGRSHFYWRCDDVPLDAFEAYQTALYQLFGTDPSVTDLPRVMRAAGTLHLKDPSNPREVTLEVTDPDKTWKLDELFAKLGLSMSAGGTDLPSQVTCHAATPPATRPATWEDGSPITAQVIPLRTPQPVFEQPPTSNTGATAWIAKLKAGAAQANATPAASELSAGINSSWYDALSDILKSEVVRYAALHLAAHSRAFELTANGGNRDDYVRIAMAIKQSGVPDAEDIFVEAAGKAKDADSEEELRHWFRGLNPNTIAVYTLFWYAVQRCASAADFSKYKAAAVGVGIAPATPATGATAGAPAAVPGVPAAVPAAASIPFPDLDKGGRPARTFVNTVVALRKLGLSCQQDTFHNRNIVGGHVIQQFAGEVADDACRVLRYKIREQFGFDPRLDNVIEAVTTLCLEHRFHPVLDYLDSLEWDQVPRLDTWLVTYFGAEDTLLNRAFGRLGLIGAVRRVRRPGTKFDQIIVLEGTQGKGKSTAIEILAGKENFSDQAILGKNDREIQEYCAGIWLYELADLTGMKKAEVEQVKAFASRTIDRARPAYGRCMVSQPRTCVFFATTNDDSYLKDNTGNRRFWPVRTTIADVESMRRDRDQLWAEAAHYEALGASIVLPENLWPAAAEQQEGRREPDPWEDVLARVEGTLCPSVSGRVEYRILTDDLFAQLGIMAKDRTDYSAKRIAGCMRRLDWIKAAQPIRIDGKQGRGFVKPAAPAVPNATPAAPAVVPAAVQPPGQTPAQSQSPQAGVPAQQPTP
jgi:hypothetical protein